MNEIWKPVVGWEGLYEVSNQGRVRSLDRTATYNDGITRSFKGRVLSPGCVQGYLQAHLGLGDRKEQRKVHQLVLEAFVGPCPDGCETRHLDGERSNNRLTNLCWGTKIENMADKRAHGRQGIGETHGRAKITADDVREIRATYARGGIIQKQLARKYGIAQSKISAIVRRELWRHVA